MAVVDRLPPHDLEAEQALLGSCLAQSRCYDEARPQVPTPAIFYTPAHVVIWKTIRDMVEKQEPIDLLTIRDRLIKKDRFDEIGGDEYLTYLAESYCDTANAPYYARQVTEAWRRRELIRAAEEAMNRAYNTHTEATAIDIATATSDAIDRIINSNGKAPTTDMLQLLDELPARLTGSSEFIPTELDAYDRKQGGIEKASVTVLAAYPSVGKTAFAMHLALKAALAGVPVQVFSLEMSQTAIMLRVAASITGHSIGRIRLAMSPDDHTAMANAVKLRLDGINMQIIDDVFNVGEIVSVARAFAHQHGSGMILVDYLQIAEPAAKANNRNEEVSNMSKAFKRLARQTGSAVLVLSQFNRAPARDNRRPQLSDLRDSGSIEQDADIVWFLHNPERGKENEPSKQSQLFWITEKNRQGGVGQLKLTFDQPTMRFWLTDGLARIASQTGVDSASGFVEPTSTGEAASETPNTVEKQGLIPF